VVVGHNVDDVERLCCSSASALAQELRATGAAATIAIAAEEKIKEWFIGGNDW